HALVMLPERGRNRNGSLIPTRSRQWNAYERLKNAIRQTHSDAGAGHPPDAASSALSQLLAALEGAWRNLAGSNSSPEDFTEWLERSVVFESSDESSEAINLLDSLDAFL